MISRGADLPQKIVPRFFDIARIAGANRANQEKNQDNDYDQDESRQETRDRASWLESGHPGSHHEDQGMVQAQTARADDGTTSEPHAEAQGTLRVLRDNR